MKNSTILKDELSLLNADRSAVLTELRNSGDKLKSLQDEILKTENELAEVRGEVKLEMARLDDIRGRAIFFGQEWSEIAQKLKTDRVAYEAVRVKISQEEKNHLGRIKDWQEKEKVMQERIANLKVLYDNNMNVINHSVTEGKERVKELNKEIDEKVKALKELKKEVDAAETREKVLTKERLKREDKLRQREKMVDGRELSLKKYEEDLMAMARDLTVVYGRMKTAYLQIDPTVDLDKLITQV